MFRMLSIVSTFIIMAMMLTIGYFSIATWLISALQAVDAKPFTVMVYIGTVLLTVYYVLGLLILYPFVIRIRNPFSWSRENRHTIDNDDNKDQSMNEDILGFHSQNPS